MQRLDRSNRRVIRRKDIVRFSRAVSGGCGSRSSCSARTRPTPAPRQMLECVLSYYRMCSLLLQNVFSYTFFLLRANKTDTCPAKGTHHKSKREPFFCKRDPFFCSNNGLKKPITREENTFYSKSLTLSNKKILTLGCKWF